MEFGIENDSRGAENARDRRRKWRRGAWIAFTIGVFLIVAASLAYAAWRERARARMEATLALAREAVDQSLSSADRDPAQLGADVPQLQEFRRTLLEKAERFYTAFIEQETWSESSGRDLAFAHFQLGHINRLREKHEDAAREYQDAIARFAGLADRYPEKTEYRAALGNAYNWLGETFRAVAARHASAGEAYDNAFMIQQRLVQENSENIQYKEELARTLYNRGMLRAGPPSGHVSANTDFREAIRLLEPLAAASDRAAQELARAYNGLGSVLAADAQRAAEVQALWERAIAIDERLVIKHPGNRAYRLDLATFCNNLAALLNKRGDTEEAIRRSRMAVNLVESLSRPAPSLTIARADAHSQRGMVLQGEDPEEAAGEYEEALDLFVELQNDRDLHRLPEFHTRLGDLLLNLAAFPRDTREVANARRLLSRAVGVYAGVASNIVASGSRADAETAIENLARVVPALPEPDRAQLTEFHQQLQRRLAGDAARR